MIGQKLKFRKNAIATLPTFTIAKNKLVASKSQTDCTSTRYAVRGHNRRQRCARASPFAAVQSTATKMRGQACSISIVPPNEATTSIWLKAMIMMMSSDLSRNTEFLENESGREVASWEPEGRSPERGKSGLILLAERSASALYLRGKLRARARAKDSVECVSRITLNSSPP
jgi:hypothetical protein